MWRFGIEGQKRPCPQRDLPANRLSACHLLVDPASSWLSIPRSKPPNVAANPIGKCIVSYDNNVLRISPRAIREIETPRRHCVVRHQSFNVQEVMGRVRCIGRGGLSGQIGAHLFPGIDLVLPDAVSTPLRNNTIHLSRIAHALNGHTAIDGLRQRGEDWTGRKHHRSHENSFLRRIDRLHDLAHYTLAFAWREGHR